MDSWIRFIVEKPYLKRVPSSQKLQFGGPKNGSIVINGVIKQDPEWAPIKSINVALYIKWLSLGVSF